jgi:DNA-binding transcriptional ArsR family regulator
MATFAWLPSPPSPFLLCKMGIDSRRGACYHTCMDVQSNNSDGRRGCCGLPGLPDARFFRALCDPTRLRILATLIEAGAPRTVSEVAEGFTVDVSVVSRHLAVLRDQGILSAERQGKEVRYSVNARFLVSALQGFAVAIESCCPSEE